MQLHRRRTSFHTDRAIRATMACVRTGEPHLHEVFNHRARRLTTAVTAAATTSAGTWCNARSEHCCYGEREERRVEEEVPC